MRIIGLIFFFLPAVAHGFSLRDAESQALDSSFTIKAHTARASALDYDGAKIISSLVPKFSLTVGKGRQFAPESNIFSTTSSELRLDLGNPFSMLAQQDQLAAQKSLLEVSSKYERSKILHAVRLLYFKVQMLAEQIDQVKKHLASVEDVAKIVENKYFQGRIHVLERDRLIIERSKQRQALLSLEEAFKGEKTQLGISLHRELGAQEELATPLPQEFSETSVPRECPQSIAVKRREIESQEIKARQSLERARVVPDFFVAYQHNANDDSPQSHRFLAGMVWNLSSERYFASKSLGMNREATKFQAQEEVLQGSLLFARLITQIKSQRAALNEQKKIVASAKSLAEGSLRQYHQGLITQKAYYDDFRVAIGEEAALLQQRYELVGLFAELSLLVESDQLFHEGLL